ncbi:hypothetical protein WL29_23290 [Burkholderia ubonensis]|uniref:Uncharacterized protein n=1 Tax=Burkholderia ubonensis TaxID=101571 RepID=A0A119HFQ1_9BURK|nr:hypothetical protein [Burkholderia ubonensis]KWA84284.1 hypothetical protein WL29_23290 [Burkholderia ubonensis]
MMPVYLFSFLMFLAAAAMLWLSDRGLVRVLGIASIMLGVPAMLLMGEPLNWRHELAGQPTTIGICLAAIAAVGAIFIVACGLSAVLRLVIAVVRSLRAAQRKKKAAEYLDKVLDVRSN